MKKIEEKLIDYKHRQGYSPVFQIGKDQSFEDIVELQKNGLNVLVLLSQKSPASITCCGQLIETLEKKKAQYQILPGSDQLMKPIVAPGFPADRFSLEYFPGQRTQEILKRRKYLKITTCIAI